MRPRFDPKEEFLVSYYRSGSSSGAGRNWIYDVAVLLVGTGFFALGVFGSGDRTWSVIGFGLIAYRLTHLALASGKYEDTFSRIIDKYESALEDADTASNTRNERAEQEGGTGQPATGPEAKSEGSDKPQPGAEGRSR